MAKERDEFTTRTLMALTTALADRAELDEQIGELTAALAREYGVKIPEAKRSPRSARKLKLGPGVGRNTTIR